MSLSSSSFDICNRIKGVLVEETIYPYVDQTAAAHLRAQRDDLGELLLRTSPAIQIEGGQARLWTFAGGRINQTLKYLARTFEPGVRQSALGGHRGPQISRSQLRARSRMARGAPGLPSARPSRRRLPANRLEPH